jgi:tetratricopeptide (TPR) repeat protein
MRLTIRRIGSLVLLASLTGCAAFYSAKDDKAAQGASKAFNEAEIGKALVTERATLVKSQAVRQGLVSRSQLALRDARLAQLIDASTAEDSWRFLTSEINDRIGKISGKTDFDEPKECAAEVGELLDKPEVVDKPGKKLNKSEKVIQLGLARRKLETVLANTKGKRSQVATKFASITDAPALACIKDQPINAPDSLKNDGDALVLIAAFNKQCKSALRTAACVAKWSTGSSGLLADINAQLDAIEVSKQAIAALVNNRRNEYKNLLAQKPEPVPGAAEKFAKDLEKALEKLDKIPFSSTNEAVNNNPVLERLAESGRLTALKEKQELLETYIEALKGNQSSTPTLAEHRVKLVANLVNRATGRPTPPTAGILMEAEFTRQQIAAAEKRIERATQTEVILKNQRDHLLDELEFLLDTQAAIKTATPSCTGKAVFAGISSGANNRCSTHASSAALSFAAAFTAGRIPAEQSDYLLIDQIELAALDESEAALLQTEGVIKAAITQIVALNASGIKPEDLAAISQALSLPVIAARVN